MTNASKAPTLADRLYQAAYDRNYPSLYNAEELRQKLFRARRFVLDERMSAFLADLSIAAFLRRNAKPIFMTGLVPTNDITVDFMPGSKHSNTLMEQMRISARLPHPITWIEHDRYATKRRGSELLGFGPVPRKRVNVDLEGWLLEQHPSVDTAFMAHVISYVSDSQPNKLLVMPISFYWATGNEPLPWVSDLNLHVDMQYDTHRLSTISEVACSLVGYRTTQVDADYSRYTRLPIDENKRLNAAKTAILLQSGTLRQIWALLATINDIPILTRDVKASRGFMGRGSYRRFLDHQTVTLQVPGKTDVRKLARHVVACARRRAHMVRGHWRHDWRHPLHPLCTHVWDADQVCKHCQGHRLWIGEHQRGDPSLGIVMTDYEVTH